MRIEKKKECKVLKEKDASVFEDKYTTLLNEMQGNVDANITYSDGYFIAILTRTATHYPDDKRTIADEFHDEGIRYVCGQCPYLENDGDKRKKIHPCKYSGYGTSRIDSECCELFYKQLMQGKITPLF